MSLHSTFLEKMEICAGKQHLDFVLLQSWYILYFFTLLNALVCVDIDQDIDLVKNKIS